MNKKQRRAAAEAKHERFMAELARSNKAALEAERERRARTKRQAAAEALRRQNSQATKTLNKLFGKVDA